MHKFLCDKAKAFEILRSDETFNFYYHWICGHHYLPPFTTTWTNKKHFSSYVKTCSIMNDYGDPTFCFLIPDWTDSTKLNWTTGHSVSSLTRLVWRLFTFFVIVNSLKNIVYSGKSVHFIISTQFEQDLLKLHWDGDLLFTTTKINNYKYKTGKYQLKRPSDNFLFVHKETKRKLSMICFVVSDQRFAWTQGFYYCKRISSTIWDPNKTKPTSNLSCCDATMHMKEKRIV